MELNILNKKLNVDSNAYHEKTSYEFWYIYCQLLNLRNPTLTDKDCNILAHILSLPNDGQHILSRVKELEEISKTSMPNIYGKCKQLTEKGFLIKNEDGYFLTPALATFQKYIQTTTNKNIKFTIPITLCT